MTSVVLMYVCWSPELLWMSRDCPFNALDNKKKLNCSRQYLQFAENCICCLCSSTILCWKLVLSMTDTAHVSWDIETETNKWNYCLSLHEVLVYKTPNKVYLRVLVALFFHLVCLATCSFYVWKLQDHNCSQCISRVERMRIWQLKAADWHMQLTSLCL